MPPSDELFVCGDLGSPCLSRLWIIEPTCYSFNILCLYFKDTHIIPLLLFYLNNWMIHEKCILKRIEVTKARWIISFCLFLISMVVNGLGKSWSLMPSEFVFLTIPINLILPLLGHGINTGGFGKQLFWGPENINWRWLEYNMMDYFIRCCCLRAR